MARDPQRIDTIINWLREEWHRYPDQRLGQLIANSAPRNIRAQSGALFQLEDSYWTEMIREAS
jgi:hypothetical protein